MAAIDEISHPRDAPLGKPVRPVLALRDATVVYPWSALNLGSPSGRYAKVNNVYQRSFSSGRVLVNPTPSTFTVKLGGTFHTLDGAVVTSVTLKANSAEILTT